MAYVDLTAEFVYKFFLTYQDMNQLADNDAYDHLPGGTVLAFYQQTAPVGWLKQTAIDDGLVRIVDGPGGGSGGSNGFSVAFSNINHTHTIASHTHAIAAHQHILDYTAAAASHNAAADPPIGASSNSHPQNMFRLEGGTNGVFIMENQTTASEGAGTTGATAPTTDAQLTNTTFKYADVIVCTKGS